MFLLDELRRDTLVNGEMQIVLARVQDANSAAIGVEVSDQPREKPFAPVLEFAGLAEVGGEFIECRHRAVALREQQRLLAHTLLKVVVELLELRRHVIESGGKFTEFIVSLDRHANVEIAGAHLRDSAAKRLDRSDHPTVQKVDNRDTARQHQHDQRKLRAAQICRVTRVFDFNQADEAIGFLHKPGQLIKIGTHCGG